MWLAALTLLAACETAPPTVTVNPLTVPGNRTDIVSVCYDSGDHERAEIEAVALAECEKPAAVVTPWRTDKILNECPLFKRTRISFVCAPAR